MATITNVAVEDAGSDLSRLVDSANDAGEVVITRAGKPVARIVPIPPPDARPKAGYGKGTILHMADDFDDPLPDFEDEL